MKLLALLAITTLAAAAVTNKAMKCHCISHGWQRNIEDTSIACQKRAGRGVQGIYEKGYCYVDADEEATFVNECAVKGKCKKNKKFKLAEADEEPSRCLHPIRDLTGMTYKGWLIRKPLAVTLPDSHFNCNTCTRQFKNREAVDQHMKALGHRKSLAVTLPDSQFGCDTCTSHFKSQEAAGQHMDDLGHRKQLATMTSEYILHLRPVGQMTDDPTGYERLVLQICPKYLTPNEANKIRLQFDRVWKENKQVL
ncbi:hypothetical protein CH063_03446 [Colletotrichum higginsianum]|uniref:C2H2-type domain-containing protein n=1 Tax=Colletotrichum higginsianum (strain IMI 349063) TaxID=759273 RepID=H1VX93_COLHI|nr:hypothetical protein CH063_03446 [Colletotrichum higginsianum]